ncbi:hypothetical protein Q428_05630 [Fervidicella metallireducens AeB]|uniref:Uncharacterized protein n=1 Tax=Fervidicella metallireducens AeB TaxID=1403537 RepID=A0A017RVQ1_9CLOT|nr:DUF6514 family protein [Fervidicella metallireducens]EYE88858.1 hypothetical protein Q428_05630 [Fervidicella metallireducens AeB]
MRKRAEVCSCRTCFQGGHEFIYRYFLLQSLKEININDKSVEIPSFGIGVVSEELNDGKIINIREDSIEHVSTYREKVLNLIEFIKANEVSPIHLIYIAGEYVDEWVNDYDEQAKLILNSPVCS